MLPQQPIDGRVEIDGVEWLFEPAWPGARCVARRVSGAVLLTDDAGAPLEDPAVTDALGRVLRAESATLDGVLAERGSVDEDGSALPAFVAIDLLELDGTSLLDVPYQERRRLLESVVGDHPAVRVGPAVKQPVARWFPAWREAGFTHYFARHQNARYHPGQRADDWLRIPIERPATTPGFLQRVVGSRGGRPRRVRD